MSELVYDQSCHLAYKQGFLDAKEEAVQILQDKIDGLWDQPDLYNEYKEVLTLLKEIKCTF